MFKVDIVADSVNEYGNRATSIVAVMPRIVLAEFNTHRMLSRNSASSRAIPFPKMITKVMETPFIPMKWMKDHSGMQGTEYFTEQEVKEQGILDKWMDARNVAVAHARMLDERGVTKQICNRLLEPFMWHTVLCTATEWENFLALRAHDAAEIHIQKIAYMILEAMNESKPKELNPGEWHVPFGDKIDDTKLQFEVLDNVNKREDSEAFNKNIFRNAGEEARVKITTARDARVTYENFEGKDDYSADIKLHDRLLASGHLSPFEHCARAMSSGEINKHYGNVDEAGWCGNFRGFTQYRKLLANENRNEPRLLKPLFKNAK